MTRKASDTDIDNAIKAYLGGDNGLVAARKFNTSQQTLSKILKAKGLLRTRSESWAIQARKLSATRLASNPISGELAAMYEAGLSENEIAKYFRVSRSAIKTRLEAAGVERRSIGEAARWRISKYTQDEKNEMMISAQEYCRGRKLPLDLQIKIAKSREKSAMCSDSERILTSWLRDYGVKCIPQRAIGIYNTDIAIHPVAVEVLGGYWHSSKPTHAERTRYILNQGWHMVFVWAHHYRSPISPAVADYIVTFLNEVGTNPSSVRQYRVIRGDGKELARRSANDDSISIVAPGYEGGRCGATD